MTKKLIKLCNWLDCNGLKKEAIAVKNLTPLFVYGTLREGEKNHGMLEDAEFLGYKTLPGFKRTEGIGPAIIPGDENSFVRGELYGVSGEALEKIDEYEGEEYPRELVTLEDGKDVYVYVYRPKSKAKSFEASERDILEAIAHLNNEEGEEGKFAKNDFEIKYYGELYADDIVNLLDESADWLTLDPESAKKFEEPADYLFNADNFDRGNIESKADFIGRAMSWLETESIPPIYIIQNSQYQNILGDGRGRLNFARAFEMPTPVFYMQLIGSK